jgi:CheY-like chemotaxis protein
MATVLVVGSNPDITRFVTESLRAEGWSAVGAVGPREGLSQLSRLPEIDAMVVGGPEAMAARGRLTARLLQRHPYARVVVPTSPDQVGQDLLEAFGGEAQ